MGFLSSLTGGGGGSTTTSSTQVPQWYSSYFEDIAQAGRNNFLGAQYPGAYQGQRVAGSNPFLQQTQSNVLNNLGRGSGSVNAATGLANNVGSGFNQNEFNQFMSPHTSGVVDRIAQLGQRNLAENLLPNVNSAFTSGGNFGSGQHQEFTQRALRDANESILGQQAQALETGFQGAMGNYQNMQNQRLQASGVLGQLGNLDQTMALKDSAALEEIGKDVRQQEQLGNDVNYANFLEGRDWNRTMTQGAAGVLNGFQPPYTTTSTTQGQGGNAAGQLLGLGTSLAGVLLGGGGGGVIGSLFGGGKARGGRALPSRRSLGRDLDHPSFIAADPAEIPPELADPWTRTSRDGYPVRYDDLYDYPMRPADASEGPIDPGSYMDQWGNVIRRQRPYARGGVIRRLAA